MAGRDLVRKLPAGESDACSGKRGRQNLLHGGDLGQGRRVGTASVMLGCHERLPGGDLPAHRPAPLLAAGRLIRALPGPLVGDAR
jgi:hypothetical protein